MERPDALSSPAATRCPPLPPPGAAFGSEQRAGGNEGRAGGGAADEPETVRLLDACRGGSRDALRRLFEAHKDRVYSIALAFFHGDAEAAEDITQEVFVRLATGVGGFRGRSSFTTWLHRLVANACIDEQRRRRRFAPWESGEKPDGGEERGDPGDGWRAAAGAPRRVAAAQATEAASAAPETLLLRREDARAVAAALATLRPDLRLTVVLKFFDELSYEETARALGCSKGTVASRIHRGLKALARRLEPPRDAGTGTGK
jgi:RNA polymerase sigma-70 factor (ECF subfamily)